MIDDDGNKCSSFREPLKTTFDSAKSAAKRRENYVNGCKKRRHKHQQITRKAQSSSSNNTLPPTMVSDSQLWPLLPITQMPTDENSLPPQWPRKISDMRPEDMDCITLVINGMNRIMQLLETPEKGQIIGIIKTVTSSPKIKLTLQEDLCHLNDLPEPPMECLHAMNAIIKAQNYIDVDTWIFLSLLFKGIRHTRDWYSILTHPLEIQKKYHMEFMGKLIPYLNGVLFPSIFDTVLRVNNSVDHIIAACHALSTVTSKYNDDTLIIIACSQADSLPMLLLGLCESARTLVDKNVENYEIPQWFNFMRYTSKLAKWFGRLLKGDMHNVAYLDGVTEETVRTARKKYALSDAGKTLAMLMVKLADRRTPKTRIITCKFIIRLMIAAIPLYVQLADHSLGIRFNNPDQEFDVNNLYTSAQYFAQTMQQNEFGDLNTKFIDLLTSLTRENFEDNQSVQPEDYVGGYRNMYSRIVEHAENMAKNFATKRALPQIMGNNVGCQSVPMEKFMDLKWNLAMDCAGSSISGEFAKCRFLFGLSCKLFMDEVRDKRTMLLGNGELNAGIVLNTIKNLSYYVCTIPAALRQRFADRKTRRGPIIAELDEILGAPSLGIFAEFINIVANYWALVDNTPMQLLDNPLHAYTPNVEERNYDECIRIISSCTLHLRVVRDILSIYHMLLTDPDRGVVQLAMQCFPNMEKFEQAITRAIYKIGTPTTSQDLARCLKGCSTAIGNLKIAYSEAQNSLNSQNVF
jgi:hypothetical protein